MLRFLKHPLKPSVHHFAPLNHLNYHPHPSFPTLFIKSLPQNPVPDSISPKSIFKNISYSTPPSSKPSSLSVLPFGILLRSYLVASLCSSSVLLSFVLRLLSRIAKSESVVLNPDRNPLLRHLLRTTFYAHFCAGESESEIKGVLAGLKRIGYDGVILTYAKETVPHRAGTHRLMTRCSEEINARDEVETWERGSLKTIDLADKGDFVALKFTGAGRSVVEQLTAREAPGAKMKHALDRICDAARTKGVGVLIDAEHHHVQDGIDIWSLQAQEQYNYEKAIVFNTYQAYLQSTPETLTQHLTTAKNKSFVLGVKLVRGAYLGTDPGHIFWQSKAETDRAYDGIAEALIRKHYNNILTPPSNHPHPPLPLPQNPKTKTSSQPPFPIPIPKKIETKTEILLATHNPTSIHKAMNSFHASSSSSSNRNRNLRFAQLMGIADDLSCDLIMNAITTTTTTRNQPISSNDDPSPSPSPSPSPNAKIKTYKYLPWGSVRECLAYLTRRADENRIGVARARGERRALGRELLVRGRGGGKWRGLMKDRKVAN